MYGASTVPVIKQGQRAYRTAPIGLEHEEEPKELSTTKKETTTTKNLNI